jgi:hypothetical protein
MWLHRNPTRVPSNGLARLLPPVVMLLGSGGVLGAGPSVEALLRVCDKAFEQGYSGREAAICEWYAAPCACKLREPNGGALPWCVPDAETIDATVRKVLGELRTYPDPDAQAETAVQAILERIYPCPGSEGQ